ncbi:unnamed protein product [Adineta ricciae]|uniref:Pentapeptide repeat-containing protein n=1 Tax=Adineta ricciae TaxID=249248 RepID=A0A814W2S8_ADIRI|nr:unnamed protein product [Adineta ricciae]
MYKKYRRAQRRNSAALLPLSLSTSTKKEEKKLKCLSWTNVALNVLVPLMIGAVTVIITVRQQETDDRRQQQERELDDRRYNLEQEQADELHNQDVFKNYITDISNTIFKQSQQQTTTFTDDRARSAYIRSQTLVALDDLDWKRKTRLFLFLYENKLLPRISYKNGIDDSNQTFNLLGANLANITLKSTPYSTLQFHQLSLPSVDLTRASFIRSIFSHGFTFHLSTMADVKFTGSEFLCCEKVSEELQEILFFAEAILTRADFQKTSFCDIRFFKTDLAYANFSNAQFKGNVTFSNTNLTLTDFRDLDLYPYAFIHIVNTDMTGSSILDNANLQAAFHNGQMQFGNVILPNGTWKIDTRNLITNGDAEICCPPGPNPGVRHWFPFPVGKDDATTSLNENFSKTRFGKCHLNFTLTGDDIEVSQVVDVMNFSYIFASRQARYELLIDANCIDGILSATISFGTELGEPISKSEFPIHGTNTSQWTTRTFVGEVPVDTDYLTLILGRMHHTGLCYVDNIQLRIFRQT